MVADAEYMWSWPTHHLVPVHQCAVVSEIVIVIVIVTINNVVSIVETRVAVARGYSCSEGRGFLTCVHFRCFRVIVERARGVPRDGRGGGMGGGGSGGGGRDSGRAPMSRSSRGPPRGSDK